MERFANERLHQRLLALATLRLGLCASVLADHHAAQPAEKPAELTQGVNHIGLTVHDLKASTAFFTDVLGWRLAGGLPDYPSAFVTDGDAFVTLWQATDPATATRFDRKNNVGLHHLSFTVGSFADLDALHARFVAAPGVVIELPPELNGDGPAKHRMIREPSGNRLEFTHSPPRQASAPTD